MSKSEKNRDFYFLDRKLLNPLSRTFLGTKLPGPGYWVPIPIPIKYLSDTIGSIFILRKMYRFINFFELIINFRTFLNKIYPQNYTDIYNFKIGGTFSFSSTSTSKLISFSLFGIFSLSLSLTIERQTEKKNTLMVKFFFSYL